MKKLLTILMVVCIVFAFAPLSAFADEVLTAPTAAAKSDDIVILATSDVHCGLEANLGYDTLVGYKKAMEAQYNYVTLVDAGDATQGEAIGTISKGEYLVDIINQVGYDILVPGNHEFDYGMNQFLNVNAKNVKGQYISCNFITLADKKTVFDPYVIKTYGDKKVAFVGICTPETIAKSTPTYFQDENGAWKYDFCGDTTGKALYDQVQAAVDAAKKAGADYIVAVGHLGDDPDTKVWKSSDVIANTTGIDVFIDGHAHQIFVTPMKNKAGKAVTCIATGTKLEYIGQVVIKSNGVIEAQNIGADVATTKDEETTKFVEEIIAKNKVLLQEVVATAAVDLTIMGEDGNRAIRSKETNLGDLCADAYKYVGETDVAFVNGGGIRATIEKGEVTYEEIIKVHPYGNALCTCEATGQEILDALEMAYRSVGTGENGGFLHLSGITCTINPYLATSVVLDEKGMFVKVAGERKVSDVKINGVDIDPAKTYTVACHNYLLKSAGDGFTMFTDNNYLKEGVMLSTENENVLKIFKH